MIERYNLTIKNITGFTGKIIDNTTILLELPAYESTALVGKILTTGDWVLKFITANREVVTNQLWYALANNEGIFVLVRVILSADRGFISLTPFVHKAWNYEKRINSFFGYKPLGHPDLRPYILHEIWPVSEYPLWPEFAIDNRPRKHQGEYSFNKIQGDSIYEIPVGPIHAGIIEPGYFRFSVAGEEIMLLEAKLGYTHKGSEKLFVNLPLLQCIKLAEKISGDSSFAHSLAFCRAVEKIADIIVPKRGEYLRIIGLELERLANHCGDIAFIMQDTGFNFGGSQGSRLREVIMRLNQYLFGNRFLRGVNVFGGVSLDMSKPQLEHLVRSLHDFIADFREIIDIAINSDTLLNRLKNTGQVDSSIIVEHGAVGVAARASGVMSDSRGYADFNDIYKKLDWAGPRLLGSGDVWARFMVRVQEVEDAVKIIVKACSDMPDGAVSSSGLQQTTLSENAASIGVSEGWRGEVLYLVTTDHKGNISRVYPHDPSQINWSLVSYAVKGNIVPDFPLINKSFNLSYSGNDL